MLPSGGRRRSGTLRVAPAGIDLQRPKRRDTAPLRFGKGCEQFRDGPGELRMDYGRRYLREGQEREDTLVEPGVRNLERRFVHDAVAVEQEIEVDLARTPTLPANPTDPLLD